MKEILTLPYTTKLPKKQSFCGNFSGLDKGAFPVAGSLCYGENVATDALPFLHGQEGLEERSVTSTGAAMQTYLFVVDETLYLVGFDGSYLTIYRVDENSHTLIHTFAEEMTTAQALTAVQDSVLCGIGYGADARGRRLLLYPLGYSAVVAPDESTLTDFVNIGSLSDCKGFISAVIFENRLFATDGYNIYASRPESLVSFVEKEGAENDDSPWCGQIPEEAENEMPIRGLIEFRGELYYFGHNSFGRIRGASYPFYVEELFSYGTVNMKSVQVVGDHLLFLGREGVYAYDGNRLRLISQKIALANCTDGVAGVKNGIYYLALSEGEGSQVYTYCQSNDSWGCMTLAGRVKMFAGGRESLYCLTEEGIHHGLYRFGGSSDGFYAVAMLHESDALHTKKLTKVKLLADLTKGAKLSCDLQIIAGDGSAHQIPLLDGATGEGTVVFSQNVAVPEGRLFFMIISATGDVSVGGYELTFTKGVGENG